MEKRHIFIINPAAGRRDLSAAVVRDAEAACRRLGLPYDIYLTSHPGHAAEIVRRTAERLTDAEPVFYACGGDGTLCEVANGVASLEDPSRCAFTSYPIGTGNDYIKMFEGGKDAFLDLDRLLTGEAIPVDVIASDCGDSLNILSVGLDAQVSMRKDRYRFLGGGIVPYALSAVESVIRGIGRAYHVEVDGKAFDDEYTLIFVGNGRYYGGGFCPVPDSKLDDGRLEVLLVKKVTRRRAAGLVMKYKNGRYSELPDLITHIPAREIRVYARDGADMCINIDGEIVESSHISMRVEPGRLRFVLPRGAKTIV